jgi:hypothetical protein
VGITVAFGYGTSPGKRMRLAGNKLPRMLMILGVIGLSSTPVENFTVYDCSNRSNIVELFSLLEPDACAASNENGEVETVAYREIVQMKKTASYQYSGAK